MSKDEMIKIPCYWLELFKDLTDEEVGIIIRAVFSYFGDDFLEQSKRVRKLFGLREEAVRVHDRCLEDIRYQQRHPRSYKKPENSQEIRNSRMYIEWRSAVYERDGYTCQCCGQVGGKLNAHHIKPFSRYPDLRFDIGNGVTLCYKCHKLAHKGGFRNA